MQQNSIFQQNIILNKKIKQLEQEIREKNRNFMFRSKNNFINKNYQHKQIQTDNFNLDLDSQYLNTSSILQSQLQTNQIQNSLLIKSSSNLNSSQYIQTLQIYQYQKQLNDLKTLLKQKDHIISQVYNQVDRLRLELQKEVTNRIDLQQQIQQIKQKFRKDSQIAKQNISDLQQIMKQSQQINNKLIQIKEELLISKQINQELQKQLQVAKEANRITKQGLLFSQQQNYNFRLQIRKLLKQKPKIFEQNIHDLSTQRSQMKFLDGVSNSTQSRIKNQNYLLKSIEKDQLEQFQQQVYSQVFKIINYLPIQNDQLLIFQADSDEQLFYQLQQIKNICFQIYQKNRNYENELDLLQKQMIRYEIPEMKILKSLDSLEGTRNLKNYAHQLYYKSLTKTKSGQLFKFLERQ